MTLAIALTIVSIAGYFLLLYGRSIERLYLLLI